MRKMILMTVIIMLFCGLCSAKERFQSMPSNSRVAYSFDTQTVKFLKMPSSEELDYNTVDVWIKNIYTHESRNDYIKYREKQNQPTDGYDYLSHSMNHYQFNIKSRTFTILSITEYNDNGSILDNHKCPEEWVIIIPESDPELWLEKIQKYVLLNRTTMAARSK